LNQHVVHTRRSDRTFDDRLLEVLLAIDTEPVEDGCQHPAEEHLRLLLFEHPLEMRHWLHNLISYETNASVVASIIKCLGRIDQEDYIDIIASALNHPDVEVRDAVVQSLEILGSTDVLKKHLHNEPVAWLRSYIQQIIEFPIE